MAQEQQNFNLISIKEKDGKQLVDARELHSFLDLKKDFSEWMRNNIKSYGFVDGQDFTTYRGNRLTVGKKPTEYTLTIDMAKELSMVSKTKRGKEARKYFIEVENKYKEVQVQMLPILEDIQERLEALEGKPKSIPKALMPPTTTEEPKPLDTRMLLNQRIRKYTQENDVAYFVPWTQLYEQMYYRYHVNVILKADKKKVKPIEILEEEGLLEEAWKVACKVFKLKGE